MRSVYLDTLCRDGRGDDALTKAEASRRIDELRTLHETLGW